MNIDDFVEIVQGGMISSTPLTVPIPSTSISRISSTDTVGTLAHHTQDGRHCQTTAMIESAIGDDIAHNPSPPQRQRPSPSHYAFLES
ncbi:hypothetical protein BN874_640028 [Candidatus Contendobacter odensis Run_B_J11]|uniref:Uncharacterized protein n=1 Tax=Candidatus Contendobacter odensis Run_B_J11 TaxID=1400861 RepID=A0A7U7J560_9GAMM|nr:hypothetical protein BN874_640028 [Candidatus Contendobacter odensis Run_B_J11]